MKTKFMFTMLLIFTVLLTACGGGNGDTAKTGNGGNAEVDDVIKMVWYPNESGEDMKSSRDEIGRLFQRQQVKK